MSMVKVLRDVGMTSTTPVDIDGQQITPLDFLYEVMPQQDDLAATAKGKTGIGMLVTGAVEGEKKQELIYTLVDHQQCYEEFGASATDFMSATALVSGANMIVTGQWKQDGVHMISEFDPQPFLKELKRQGLDYKVLEEAPDLEVSEHGAEEEAE